MSTLDEHPETEAPETDGPVRGAQTVAPVQASALQFAASILGEGSYTPSQQLGGSLTVPSRVHEEQTAPVEGPVQEAVAAPVEAPEPAAEVAQPAPAPVRVVESTPTKGWFARLLDKLFGRS